MSHLTSSLREFKEYFEKKNIKIEGSILDIGCKDVSSKEFFTNLGLDWTGIDNNPQQPQGEVITMDMTDLNFPNNSFDFVFICHSLEHCLNPLKALLEAKRICKGYIFISMPCYCEKHVLMGDKDHIFIFTPMQLTKLAMYLDMKFEVFDGNKSEELSGYGKSKEYNVIGVLWK